jgi:hypothetical protein
MPTNRFQFSDDFVLNANKVGINSSTPQEELDVVGVVKADNLKVTGVSSFTSYEGFLNSNHNIAENITLTSGTSGSLSGEIIVGTGITLSGISSTTSGQGHIDSLKVYNTLTIPVGGTLERPSKANPGQLYYNKDFATIEFYDGDRWRQVDNTTTRGRGVFGATVLTYVNISSTGNALNFGTSTTSREALAAFSSSTRGMWSGGYQPGGSWNIIDYVTIASEGNAIDFGDLTVSRYFPAGCSSSTRGLTGGGFSTFTNTIDYVQIATIGNALDFGDLTSARSTNSSTSSATRGVWGGGQGSNIIDFVTIASLGNAVTFGTLTTGASQSAGCSSPTRGIFGGTSSPAYSNVINYITFASTGNAVYFGDLTQVRAGTSACSSSIRGVFAGGVSPITSYNIIDYVTIASTGNAQDFGDLTKNLVYNAACSDSHGGLGGF